MIKYNFRRLAFASTLSTFAIGLSALSTQAATMIEANFTQSGFSTGGTLTGSFSGTDVNMDGIFDTGAGDTIDTLTATFAGDTTVADITLGLSELDSTLVLDFTSALPLPGTFSATNFNFFLQGGGSFIDVLFDGGDQTTEIEDSIGNFAESSTLIEVTITEIAVEPPEPPTTTPEPSSIFALLTVLGLGFIPLKRKTI